jgi:hypothetical protein
MLFAADGFVSVSRAGQAESTAFQIAGTYWF